MAQIVFITPNDRNSYVYESAGTLILATILRSAGLDVEIKPFLQFGDAHDFSSFLEQAEKQIKAADPKIVSFYTRCDNFHIMLKLAERIHQICDAYIVFGGPHADITAEATLRSIPYVDYVCRGEGETTVLPFFTSLLNGTPDLSIPGLAYRKDGDVVTNPRPAMLEDLDTTPMIDYSFVDYDMPADGEPFPIDAGRGCPFGCTYCSTKTFWGRKYRLKSPQRLVDEMVALYERFGVTYVVFTHDMFTMNRKLVIETCRLIKALPYELTWRCSSRLDCLDKELIDIMADAGLVGMQIGVESGSPRMQKLINKNLKLDGLLDTFHYIHEKGISILASFIFGFPEETEEDVSLTLDLLGKLAPYRNIGCQTHLLTFLPGTEMSLKYKDQLTQELTRSDSFAMDVAQEECADLIAANPELFWHFRDYRTPLRDKLKDFTLFFYMWKDMPAVITHIAQAYTPETMIQMYFKFAEANKEFLEKTRHLDTVEQYSQLLEADKFLDLYREDPYYDLMKDYARLRLFYFKLQTGQISGGTEIFCFSPTSIKEHIRLEEIPQALTFVTASRDAEGNPQMQFRTR